MRVYVTQEVRNAVMAAKAKGDAVMVQAEPDGRGGYGVTWSLAPTGAKVGRVMTSGGEDRAVHARNVWEVRAIRDVKELYR